MTKTTKQNSYLVYFRSIYGGTTINSRSSTNRSLETVFIIFATYLLMYVLGQASTVISDDGGSISFSAVSSGWLFYASILALGTCLRNKPSVFNLLPISWQKRTVYFYVTVLVNVVLVVLGLAIIFSAVVLFIALIVFATSGEWIFTTDGSELPVAASATVQGQLFGVCVLILIIGVATLLCFINGTKLRRFMYFVFPVALSVPLLIMINIAEPVTWFTLNGSLYANFNNLPLSWLWLTLSAVLAITVFVFGVLRLIKHERPANY